MGREPETAKILRLDAQLRRLEYEINPVVSESSVGIIYI